MSVAPIETIAMQTALETAENRAKISDEPSEPSSALGAAETNENAATSVESLESRESITEFGAPETAGNATAINVEQIEHIAGPSVAAPNESIAKESASETDENATTKTRRAKNWNLTDAFDDNAQLKQFLGVENWWKRNKTTRTTDGLKVYYYCGEMKCGRKTCQAQMYVLHTGKRCHVYRNGEHTHKEANQKVVGAELQTRIQALVNGHMKLRAISHLIRNDASVAVKPSDNQVRIYLVLLLYNSCM